MEGHVPHICLPPRISPNSTLPLHTQKQCTARGSSWGLPSLSLTTEGSWIHLGEGRQTPHQPADASTPGSPEVPIPRRRCHISDLAEFNPLYLSFAQRTNIQSSFSSDCNDCSKNSHYVHVQNYTTHKNRILGRLCKPQHFVILSNSSNS